MEVLAEHLTTKSLAVRSIFSINDFFFVSEQFFFKFGGFPKYYHLVQRFNVLECARACEQKFQYVSWILMCKLILEFNKLN